MTWIYPRVVLQILGVLLLGFSLTMLPPIGVSLWFDDGEVAHFVYALGLILGLGLACWLPVRRRQQVLRTRDGFLVVALFWIALSTLSAIPFIFSPHLSFGDAIFESVSGFTTTGATVIVGLDDLPESILYYRQQLQWLGGMGIIVLAVAIMPMLSVGGMQLYKAETPGPMKEEKLTPRIKQTALSLWSIYVVLTVACAVALRLAGMSWFDAVGHAFGTVSTGGFSTHDASLGYFDSALIEGIVGVFMVLGAVNFALHFAAVRGLRAGTAWRPYWRDEELRTFVLVLAGATLVTGWLLASEGYYPDLASALRRSAFQVASFITSTGFTTAPFPDWPFFVPMLLILVSFVGGCAGSTAGGMKVIRWLLIYRQGAREIRSLIHPRAMFALKFNGRPVPERVVTAVWGFFSAYVLTFALLMVLMMWTGVDQVTAFAAVATCMNNLGPGLGEVSSNFITMSGPGIAIGVVAMLLGRLEIFTLLVIVNPSFWRD